MKHAAVKTLAVIIASCTMLATATAQETIGRRKACELIDSRGSDPLTGLWRMGGDGATFAVLPVEGSSTSFDIVIIDSPDMSVLPGTRFGHATTTGRSGTYDAELYGDVNPTKRKLRYILSIDDNGLLTFKSYKRGKRIALWRWIPYLFRMTVSDYNTRPEGVDGAVKLYPAGAPIGPITL